MQLTSILSFKRSLNNEYFAGIIDDLYEEELLCIR